MLSGAKADHAGYAQIAIVAMTAAGYWGDLPMSTHVNMVVATLAALAPATVRPHHLSLHQVTEIFPVPGLVPSRRHHSCCVEQLAHGKWASCRPRHRIRSRMFRSEPNGRHRGHGQQPRGCASKHAESGVDSVGKSHSQCLECILLEETPSCLLDSARICDCAIRGDRSQITTHFQGPF